MSIVSVVAIYFLIWVFCAFIMLPFGIRTHEELGESKVSGQADSAPGNFRPVRLVIFATVLSAVLTGLWVLNWTHRWITFDTINFIPGPASSR